MDPILRRFRRLKWRFAPQDPEAQEILAERIAEVGRRRGTVTYSALVFGVTFNLPSLGQQQHLIDVYDWHALDRAILSDFLGYLSMKSFESAGFLCSALVVSKSDGTPGDGFYSLL